MAAVAHEARALKIENKSPSSAQAAGRALRGDNGEGSPCRLAACALFQLDLSLIDDAVIGVP